MIGDNRMPTQGSITEYIASTAEGHCVLFLLVAVIVGRVAFLLATGSKKNALHRGRFWGFALGYSVLAATAADVFIEVWNSQPLSGHSLLFILASNLLIFFRGGDHQKPACEVPGDPQ